MIAKPASHLRRSSFAAFLVAVASTALSSAPAPAQNAVTQPYLLTLDACTVGNCVGPNSQHIYFVQSPNGVTWTPVPGYTPVQGSVSAPVRRGNTIYIVTQAPGNQISQMQTIRYHMDTNRWDPPVAFTIQDGQNAGPYIDPALGLDSLGRLFIIYDTNNMSCAGSTCHVRMAVEVNGSDGTQFVAQAADLITAPQSTGVYGDPSVPFWDGTQWVIYVNGNGQELAIVSQNFTGPYSLYSGLPNGQVTSVGQIMSGLYNPPRGKIWNFLSARNFTISNTANVIDKIDTTSLAQQITGGDQNGADKAVVTPATLGIGADQHLNHPHIAGNWSGSPTVFASVLPLSRSVQVGATATAFATIINTDIVNAADCYIKPITAIPATFSFQTTNPSTNALTGTANTPATINANNGFQTFVFAFTPTAAFAPTDVQLTFGCVSSTTAAPITGVSTLLLSGSASPVPDVVALSATPSHDGIINIPGANGAAAFSVASVNVGSSASIGVIADTGGASLPVTLTVCQTNPNGSCMQTASPTVTTTINANATPTFSVFAQGTGNVPFDPAVNRIFVRFKDSGGATRGSTSVAVRTQ